MHSSEHGKSSEDEEGIWSVKKGEVHISVDGDNFIFEIKGDGNLQVVALLNNGVLENAPERIEEGHFPEGLLGMAMLPIIGSVIAICRYCVGVGSPTRRSSARKTTKNCPFRF